jgi:tungstate transport system substrate-binding protein
MNVLTRDPSRLACRIIWLLSLLLALLAAPALFAAPPRQGVLRLATTTSTYDSGLLDWLLPEFEQSYKCTVEVVAVGTGQSLELGRRGDADVVLVHSRPGEDKFVADGFARERFDVMYNDFILVGPKSDPAGVRGLSLAKDAFEKILEAKAPFASRGDKSGTHTKELSIWASLGVTPGPQLPGYASLGQGMGETLLFADEQQAYTLSDRGTYLAMRDKLPGLDILVGGSNLEENKDKLLINAYGVLAVNPDKYPQTNYELAMKFVDWLCSPATQRRIGSFGVERFGQPLFYPDSKAYKASK